MNKVYGTTILVSESTYKQAALDVVARPVDYVAVKGKRFPVLVYELIGLKADEAATDSALIALCALGLEHYRSREWAAAIASFEEVLQHRPGDRSALLVIERCRSHQDNAPEPDWDGVSRMEHK